MTTIAIQGSGTADAPYVAFHVDLTGQTNAQFSFDARDLDAGADNAHQQIGGPATASATPARRRTCRSATSPTPRRPTQHAVTHRDVALPAALDGQSDVYVRVMTTNAGGNDELVGIDNIAVSMAAGPRR